MSQRNNYWNASELIVGGGFNKQYFLNGGSRDMAIDGSSTPKDFDCAINTLDREKLLIALVFIAEMDTNGLDSMPYFLNLTSALTNGLYIKALDSKDNVIFTLGGASCNCDLLSYTRNIHEVTFAGGGVTEDKGAVIGFIDPEYPIVLPQGIAKFRITVSDDISDVTHMSLSATVIQSHYNK